MSFTFSIVIASPETDVQPLGLGGDFDENISRIYELGYDGVELFVEDPYSMPLKEVKEKVSKHGLKVTAIGTGLTYTKFGLSFTSPSPEIREKAVDRIIRYIRLAEKLEADVIIGSVKGRFEGSYQDGWNNLRSCLERCSREAERAGIHILLEPLNRYESNIVNTLDEGVKLIREIGSGALKLLADTFHMNIEERSIPEAIRKARHHLAYLHFSDSNRQAPGSGHINFKEVIDVLKEIGYDGTISFEILPIPDQFSAARQAINQIKKLV